MDTSTLTTHAGVSADLQALAAMGMLLERLERLPRSATAAQYRDVAAKVQDLLTKVQPGLPLDALLNALPATAELYENQCYAQAGLCRSPQEAAFESELAVRGIIAAATGAARPH